MIYFENYIFLSNIVKPELLATTCDALHHEFNYENIADDDEIGIWTANTSKIGQKCLLSDHLTGQLDVRFIHLQWTNVSHSEEVFSIQHVE